MDMAMDGMVGTSKAETETYRVSIRVEFNRNPAVFADFRMPLVARLTCHFELWPWSIEIWPSRWPSSGKHISASLSWECVGLRPDYIVHHLFE